MNSCRYTDLRMDTLGRIPVQNLMGFRLHEEDLSFDTALNRCCPNLRQLLTKMAGRGLDVHTGIKTSRRQPQPLFFRGFSISAI